MCACLLVILCNIWYIVKLKFNKWWFLQYKDVIGKGAFKTVYPSWFLVCLSFSFFYCVVVIPKSVVTYIYGLHSWFFWLCNPLKVVWSIIYLFRFSLFKDRRHVAQLMLLLKEVQKAVKFIYFLLVIWVHAGGNWKLTDILIWWVILSVNWYAFLYPVII